MKILIASFVLVTALAATNFTMAQTPYDYFEPIQSGKDMLQLPITQFRVSNVNIKDSICYLTFDKDNQILSLFNVDGSIEKSIKINPLSAKFTTMDRFAEKYPWQSPYCYAANNPVNYIDVNGDSIWISYNDANGQQQRMLYNQGMKYDGNDSFISSVITSLNKMGSVDLGKTVLDQLTGSQSNYNFTNTFAKNSNGDVVSNALQFDDRTGEIHAGALLSNTIQGSQKIEATGHELFHAYQSEFGETGGTINREVGAYVFGRTLVTNLGYGSQGYGNFSQSGLAYENAMTTLANSPTFNQQAYNSAINNFRQGSSVNANGIYNRFIIRTNDINPVIKSFYPLIK